MKNFSKIFYSIKNALTNFAIICYYSFFGSLFYLLSNKDDLILIKNKTLQLYSPITIKSFFKSIKWGDLRYMYNEIFFKNKYNKFYKLKEGDIVIDCGANVGYYSCKAATEVGSTGLVIAIEPDKTLFEILLKNISINNLDNVISINKGIWDKKDRLVLYTSNKHPGDSSFTVSPFNDNNQPFEVEVDTLENILKILKIKKVDFLKMDIEGAETMAIRGSNNLLKSNDKMKFAIAAYHKSTNNTFTSTEVLSLLKSIGIKGVFLTPDNFIYKV